MALLYPPRTTGRGRDRGSLLLLNERTLGGFGLTRHRRGLEERGVAVEVRGRCLAVIIVIVILILLQQPKVLFVTAVRHAFKFRSTVEPRSRFTVES
jgi:hypothetical protein